MTNPTFTPGAEVYNVAGAVAQYVGPAPYGGHVVMPTYEHDYDDEPHFGGPEVWPEVFAKLPREKLAGDLTELHQDINDARQQLESVLTKVADAERTKVILEREAAKNPDLAPLALWLSGEAKYAVILGGDYGNQFYTGDVRAGEIPEVFKSEDRNRDIRLVSLYWEPEAERRHSVRIARYSDGSGGKDRRVFIGRTQQEAMDAAAAHVAEQQKFHQNDYHYPQIGVWLEHFGYGHLINARVRKAMDEYEAKARINRAKSARDQLTRAEAALAAARDELQKTEQAA